MPPGGTVTFVFTDIEGSTPLVAEHPESYPAVLARYRRLVGECLDAVGGHLVGSTGDGCVGSFADPAAALAFAAGLRRTVDAEPWPPELRLHLRVGVHQGPAEPSEDGGYVALTVHQSARIGDAANGDQIILSPTVASSPVPEGCTVEPIGSFLIRDFPSAVDLFELVVGGLPRRLSPPRAAPAPTGGGLRRTSFVGRYVEQGEILHLLGHHRLVSLVGMGGVGKTRLATEVGARGAPTLGRQVVVELAPVAKDDGVFGAIGAALGLPEPRDDDWAGAIVAYLSANRLLLILDNCEHVVEGAATAADVVIERCPDARVLATSREALRVEGERVVQLGPLAVPPEGAATDTLLANDGVRLLVDRAVAAGAPATVETDDLIAAAAVVRALDGVPLALELAGARVGPLGYDGVLAGLADRFELLSQGRRTAPERQRSLLAMVEWSHSLLNEDERLLFRAVAVPVGWFPVELAAALVPQILPVRVPELLRRLADRSLLEVRPGEKLQFRMLETLRDFGARELAERAELRGVADRLLGWWSRLYDDDAAPAIAARIAEGDAVEGLSASPELSPGADLETWARVCYLAARWYDAAGYFHEVIARVERCLARVRGAEVSEGLLLLLHGLAAQSRCMTGQGSVREVEELAAGLAAARDITAGMRARVTGMLAACWLHLGLPEAESAYRKAWELAPDSSFASGVGLLRAMAGDFDEGRTWLERSLAMARETGDVSNESVALGNLAEIALRSGDPDGARDLTLQRPELQGRPTSVKQVIGVLGGVASWLADHGDATAAVALLACRTRLAREIALLAPGDTEARHVQLLDRMRDGLGEEAYAAAYATGAGWSSEQAVAEARAALTAA